MTTIFHLTVAQPSISQTIILHTSTIFSCSFSIILSRRFAGLQQITPRTRVTPKVKELKAHFDLHIVANDFVVTPSDPPRGIRIFSLAGGQGFELENFSTLLKEKCRNFSICFKETGGSLKSRCSCAASYQFLQKQYCRCLLYL